LVIEAKSPWIDANRTHFRQAKAIRSPSPADIDVARWGVFTASYADGSEKLRNCQLTIYIV